VIVLLTNPVLEGAGLLVGVFVIAEDKDHIGELLDDFDSTVDLVDVLVPVEVEVLRGVKVLTLENWEDREPNDVLVEVLV
jgi:hypothetical protein